MEVRLPKISIIVPVYNVENYLSKCVESILGQEEQEWELILIDDGSEDGSALICDRYAGRDSRIVVVHKENEGVSVARNVGLSLARAEWICFVDSDDWVEPGYLSDMLAWVADEFTVVYGSVILDYEGDRHSSIALNYKEGDSCELTGKDAARFLLGNRIIENGWPIAKIFNRKILANGLKFNISISYHEDHIFVLDYLLSVKRIVLSSKPNYHYVHRSSANSLSKKKHPTKNMVIASNELLRVVTAAISLFSINDTDEIGHLYTLLGLNQLVRAALDADSHDLSMVGDVIRGRRELFRNYYSPNHSYVKLIPFLFFIRLDKSVLWISRLLGKHL